MQLSPPPHDEVEVSVFGRGFGEAICVHMGDGEWLCVDSCRNPSNNQSAALAYLNSMGLEPSAVVKVVIATHWHDDHVRGLADVVSSCPEAAVVMSAAVRSSEFVSFVVQQEGAGGVHGSGVDELRSILRTQALRERPILWAKGNAPLHPLPPGYLPRLVALSPSEDAFERSLMDLISIAADAQLFATRRYRAPESSNGSSVAAWLRSGEVSVLLGADLECTTNREAGWDAVLTYCKPPERASAIKVPHHGSQGAHHQKMWEDILESQPLTLLTPWIRGNRSIPTEADMDRLRMLSQKSYITALPSRVLANVKKDPVTRKLHGSPIMTFRGWGHIRARRNVQSGGWNVELSGDATKL